MRVFPTYTVERFEQLKPGELFFLEALESSFVALKAVDNEQDGDKLMVLLGPKFPEHTVPGQLLPWHGVTVVSLGTNYSIRLSTSPESWTTQPPPEDVLPVILQEGELYLRGRFVRLGGAQSISCMVKISDGAVEYKLTQALRSYCLRWEISIMDDNKQLHSVLKVGGGT